MNDHFREVWADFDPEATSFINMSQLRSFLIALGEPLGFGKALRDNRNKQDELIAQLDLPTYREFSSYQYMDVLDALSFRLMVIDHIKKHASGEDLLEKKATQFSFGRHHEAQERPSGSGEAEMLIKE